MTSQKQINEQKIAEHRAFFHGYPDLDEENAIAKEKNTAADAYENEHGRGSDIRYPGYVWMYGTLIRVG